MKNLGRNIGVYVIVFIAVLSLSMVVRNLGPAAEYKEIKFSQFANHLESGDYEKVNITDRQLTGTRSNGDQEITYSPSALEINWLESNILFPMIDDGKVELESDPPKSEYTILNMLPTILMLLAMGFLFYFMLSQGGNKQAFQFGKNRARLYKTDGKEITFKNVAGLEEEKEELAEIVDFLKNPVKYDKLGARIPKGVLLVGQPGTGKTYISRATAGEAGVPFFTISGSDFVEMFVGVGASRVRDLFNEAKRNAPCIVFIDEIDAVGRRRGAGLGGGNDEREQTLNQLLVEMDGFDGNLGIIILAATNRPDVLDPALLRPGRFDRQVVIGMPDIKGREELFRLYTKNKPLAEDVSPEILAKRTPGFSPADIENLINEAALLTARRNGTKIRMDEIEEATTKVMAGPQKKSRVISDAEKKLTAYHEAGHAIVMRALPGSDPVHQITIIPRGMAGGFTMWLPEEDRFFETRGHMINNIKHLLGGRVAEELKLEDISTGASNDLERATGIARQMVTKYGFSKKLGPVSFSSNDEVFLGRDFSTRQNISEEVAAEVDHEIRNILEECYGETRRILRENNAAFERVAQALLLVETLDGDQFERLFTGVVTPEGIRAEVEEEMRMLKRMNESEAKESALIDKAKRQEFEQQVERMSADDEHVRRYESEAASRPQAKAETKPEDDDEGLVYERPTRHRAAEKQKPVKPAKLTREQKRAEKEKEKERLRAEKELERERIRAEKAARAAARYEKPVRPEEPENEEPEEEGADEAFQAENHQADSQAGEHETAVKAEEQHPSHDEEELHEDAADDEDYEDAAYDASEEADEAEEHEQPKYAQPARPSIFAEPIANGRIRPLPINQLSNNPESGDRVITKDPEEAQEAAHEAAIARPEHAADAEAAAGAASESISEAAEHNADAEQPAAPEPQTDAQAPEMQQPAGDDFEKILRENIIKHDQMKKDRDTTDND
ncbi:MAG: ATP-dependent zinc metalloprotease FtsH [Mogibacterium sp.]|nr:ATP-dependent zinc metalloprotease FtsH [Mogibacterium sp.]